MYIATLLKCSLRQLEQQNTPSCCSNTRQPAHHWAGINISAFFQIQNPAWVKKNCKIKVAANKWLQCQSMFIMVLFFIQVFEGCTLFYSLAVFCMDNNLRLKTRHAGICNASCFASLFCMFWHNWYKPIYLSILFFKINICVYSLLTYLCTHINTYSLVLNSIW